MTSLSDPGPVLYASVSCGNNVLADLLPAGEDSCAGSGAGAGGLSALAAICLDAAPHFHLLYTHTAGSRIYAFLMAEPLLFFAIAEESLGRSAVILFLHRLHDATVYIARRRIGAGDPLAYRCLQDELLPVIRRLVAGSVSPSEEEKPSPSSPPALSPPPLPSTPQSSDSILLTGEHKRKVKKERKKNPRIDEGVGDSRGGDEHEISVTDNDGEADLGLGLGGWKSMQRIWWRQVRMVLIIDLVVCSLLFGIWLSVCKGFQCIGG
ncbi:phytolongin Phyl1.1-like [Dendrobium catenatum]|uniref:Putative VAMP-like protein n=1 Tax=Dendrobium catenatum TaxID=906689 RepID=A0A2I0WC54_9ASPA|nr:phytolongin Phyl1.1-like [Dendrobium catenatum]PKU73245.1 putative VAMP-like protein [Dendrobium catenatum]